MAELDYGKEKMDQYRRSADRVGEPQPSFDYVWTESVAIVKAPPLKAAMKRSTSFSSL